MAVSGSKDFEPNVAEYIEEAFERCGLEFRTGYDARTARRSINFLFADWANRGLNRWTIDQVNQTLVSGLSEYPIGTITATVGSSTNLVVGNTITGSSSGTTAIVLTKPSSTTVTLSIPSGSFTAGETITSTDSSGSAVSTTISSDPSISDVRSTIDVLSSVIRRSDSDISINRVSRDDYLSIPTKTTSGRPVQFYPCLAAGLAYYLSVKRAPDRVPLLKTMYEEEFLRAAEEDRDRASFSVVPSYSYLTATS